MSALAGEAQALLAGVLMAKVKGLKRVIFESDCKNLIDALKNDRSSCPWQIQVFIQDIDVLIRDEQYFVFNFISRSANRAADWISKNVNFLLFNPSWTCNIPAQLEAILYSDAIGC